MRAHKRYGRHADARRLAGIVDREAPLPFVAFAPGALKQFDVTRANFDSTSDYMDPAGRIVYRDLVFAPARLGALVCLALTLLLAACGPAFTSRTAPDDGAAGDSSTEPVCKPPALPPELLNRAVCSYPQGHNCWAQMPAIIGDRTITCPPTLDWAQEIGIECGPDCEPVAEPL